MKFYMAHRTFPVTIMASFNQEVSTVIVRGQLFLAEDMEDLPVPDKSAGGREYYYLEVDLTQQVK